MMRADSSLSVNAAAKRVGVSTSHLKDVGHSGGVFVKDSRGRLTVPSGGTDELPRSMVALTNTGLTDVVVIGNRNAALLNAYMGAIQDLLSGKNVDLSVFSGVVIDGFELETDTDVISSFADDLDDLFRDNEVDNRPIGYRGSARR